ncbi:MAG: DDE transposase family protein [Bacteroidota bacterium]
MTINEKRELAEYLYTSGAISTQTELALRVKVSEVTISKWKNKYKWDDKRKSLLVTRGEELRNLYDQLSELNQWIKDREQGQRFATSKEADTLRKLTASIRELETEVSIGQTIDVFIGFNDWLQKVNHDKAKEMIELQDAYVKSLY